ncbi:MAG: alpha/beta hydrolase [Lentilactobacillus diolivorans]|nr:alpha/beta hydrolase [Lentilactobacillus diolivorans]
MSYYYRPPKNNHATILFFQAFGGDSDYYNFKTVIDNLSQDDGILTFDYLGYGLSDLTDKPQTLSNTVNEFRQLFDSLKLGPTVIFAHSIGGVFGLYDYLNFSNHVVAFISIEPTTYEVVHAHPKGAESFAKAADAFNQLTPDQKAARQKDLAIQGDINPLLSAEDAAANTKILAGKMYNRNLVAQTQNWNAMLKPVANQKLPNHLPTLLFSTTKRQAEFKQSGYLTQHPKSRLIALEGNHYLHWKYPKLIAKTTDQFIDSLG